MSVLIELRNVVKQFDLGVASTKVLQGINLRIDQGEFVAIIGASGSGKSTLMNIIGCLDVATSGDYFFEGSNVKKFNSYQLANIRSARIGFIFQRYHLINQLDALHNVEVPAIYAGYDITERRRKAIRLLQRIGLGERMDYYPNQLSGGQQQRISIARALINHPDIILADEPTGALDSVSGEEILTILQQLHDQGYTVIIITHDAKIAVRAQRIITIKDGQIVDDHTNDSYNARLAKIEIGNDVNRRIGSGDKFQNSGRTTNARRVRGFLLDIWELFRLALPGIVRHKVKTFLTMLGIIIGIASVVTVVAIGECSKQRILDDIASLGNRTVAIFPGKDWGDVKSGKVETLVQSDFTALAKQSYATSVSPVLNSTLTVRYANQELSVHVYGVDQEYFKLRGLKLKYGRLFNAIDIQNYHQVAIIDSNSYQRIFNDQNHALNKVLFISKLPCKIIGVTQPKDSPFGQSQQLEIWLPYTTFARKLSGKRYFNSIMVQLDDRVTSSAADASIQKLLIWRHSGVKDFFTTTSESIMQTITQTANNMTTLISAIAAISLLVGGIGVMNIMLVSVTERTKEIGIRLAVGAQTYDVLLQFILEAVLLCLIGGLMGLGLAWLIGKLLPLISVELQLQFSWSIAWIAVSSSSAVGIVFGYLPAKRASKLTPITALSRD